jgi:hypothetical protein
VDLLSQVSALEAAKAGTELDELVLDTITARDLVAATPEEPDWLVPNLLARGWAMMVSAREKTGKGTFIAYLIGCLEKQCATVFGMAYEEPLTALIFTEEPSDSTAEKARDGGLLGSAYLFGWEVPSEIRTLPRDQRWAATAKALVNTAVEGGHALLFVDNVSRAAGIEDEAGTEMSRAVEVLAEHAKRAGLTLIVDHHHRKSGGDMRDRSRGGTGAVGAVDVSLSMDRGKDAADRRRPLSCVGRRRATNWAMTIEMDEDGGGYSVVEARDAEDSGAAQVSSREARRLQQLRELCATQNVERGNPWISAQEIAEAWGLKANSTKAYLRDRIPSGEVIEGPTDGVTKTYAAPGWETADAAVIKPAF